MADLRRNSHWLALGIFAAGCTGQVGTSDSPGETGGNHPGTTTLPGPSGGSNNTFIDQTSRALSRLTNAEYSQTVSDLLGEAPDAATRYRFPIDPRQHGFDNNTALLQVSTAHGGQYETAAEAIAVATFASPDRRARVLTCDPAAGESCLRTFIAQAGRKLYRRPIADDEVGEFLALAKATSSTTDPTVGMQSVLEAMLQSPHFLYRVELGLSDAKRPGIVGLTGFEMATRLSFFLLGTSPNDALLDRAQQAGLDRPADVNAAVQQMLSDPRAQQGARRFYGQWLPLTEVSGPSADQDRIPHGDTALAADLVTETGKFVDDVLWGGHGTVLDLLTARYTFVNKRLAAIYSLPAPAVDWQRVDFPADAPRAGFPTKGSILAAGSHPDNPSNTRRGQLVREQLLCTDVPSPPPGVNAMVPPAMKGETEQQTFTRHTTDPSCASCHQLMDPIGWGLSGFDVTGAARVNDSNGQPLSTKGRITGWAMPDFSGPVELAQKLAASNEFKACFAQQLFRFAYGRTETAPDMAGISQLANSFQGVGWDFAKGLAALTTSDGFRYRAKGDAP